MAFGEPMGEFVVLAVNVRDVDLSGNVAPASTEFRTGRLPSALRARQRRQLSALFDKWYLPYHGALPGWRRDSPIHLVEGSGPIGGVYLCDRNEHGKTGYGDLQYTWIAPDRQGRGLYRPLFEKALTTAREWGLAGIVINTDRAGLPEMYLRWGATEWRRIPKAPPSTSFIDRGRRVASLVGKYAKIGIERWRRG